MTEGHTEQKRYTIDILHSQIRSMAMLRIFADGQGCPCQISIAKEYLKVGSISCPSVRFTAYNDMTSEELKGSNHEINFMISVCLHEEPKRCCSILNVICLCVRLVLDSFAAVMRTVERDSRDNF